MLRKAQLFFLELNFYSKFLFFFTIKNPFLGVPMNNMHQDSQAEN